MLLSARFLIDVGGVNAFKEVASIQMTEGDTLDVYLQLVDLSVNTAICGFNPPGRRFVPASGAVLQVLLDSLDNAKKLVKTCIQPFANDPSIWKFTIFATDDVKGTKNLKLTLTESGKVTRGVIQPAVLVSSLDGLSQ